MRFYYYSQDDITVAISWFSWKANIWIALGSLIILWVVPGELGIRPNMLQPPVLIEQTCLDPGTEAKTNSGSQKISLKSKHQLKGPHERNKVSTIINPQASSKKQAIKTK